MQVYTHLYICIYTYEVLNNKAKFYIDFSVPFWDLTLYPDYSFALNWKPLESSLVLSKSTKATKSWHQQSGQTCISAVISLPNDHFNLHDGHLRSAETPHRHIARGLC